GVVHRDVKPANVLFDVDGHAYLADFGLAVAGIETGGPGVAVSRTAEPPYASPEVTRGEGPTVASDIFALGVLLAEAASGKAFPDSIDHIPDSIWSVVNVAVAANPADRYPDVGSLRLALREAVGESPTPVPRTIRRNPYKGLEPFDEGDTADFYGRDDVVDTLLDAVASLGLVALVGASGSGKSSVVRAGLVPALREGAITGSEEWSIVTMVPGIDPFEEFQVALRDVAVGSTSVPPEAGPTALRQAFAAALDGPNSRALLFIDQFEELFSPGVIQETRERFIDNLIDLAADPSHRVRIVVTMRADFSDRPLAHARFGDLFARSSHLLAPMRLEQVEEAIRGPAGRVGVEVEPGLVSEISRDIAEASAYLPLLQYILAELFELRTEDRLTVRGYRSLGGVEGVLQRRAEATYASLGDDSRRAARQLFLRMVHLGDHGEQTRRRLPLTEVSGLGHRASIDAALEAFSTARLLTYDRDPVSRTPTVEVTHETVIDQWTRYRIWLDEARSDLLAHRRITAAAASWVESGEDPAYLLTGGPLSAAIELASGDRIRLNDLETRFVEESRDADERARKAEEQRSRHERELQRRSRRRLAIGVGAAVIALVVGTLAVFAFLQRQRADELAAQQSRENLAREVAALSLANLDSGDPDLSLLLGIMAAEETLDAGGDILPEAIEALHRAVINPRPTVIITGALGDNDGEAISYSRDGNALAFVTEGGEVVIVDPADGSEHLRIQPGSPAVGVDFHPRDERVVSIHTDGAAEWDLVALEERWIPHAGISTAAYSRDGSVIAIGDDHGSITLYHADGEVITLEGHHEGRIMSVDFDRDDTRLVSAGFDGQSLVWDLASARLVLELEYDTAFCVWEASWHPIADQIVVTLCHGEAFTFDADSGARLRPISQANQFHSAMVYDSSGGAIAGAGRDGVTRIFNSEVGGSSVFDIRSGGVPVKDVEFSPRGFEPFEVASLGLDGELRIYHDVLAWSELPSRITGLLYPFIKTTPDGSRYVVFASGYILGLPQDCEGEWAPVLHVFDAATDEVLATHETVCTLGQRPLPAIKDDGSLLAFVGPSLNVVLLDVTTGTSAEIPDSARWTRDLAFSSDGRLLAGVGQVGPGAGQVAVWDVSSLSRIRVMSPGLQSVPAGKQLLSDRGLVRVAFLPRSDDLITAGLDGSVRRWSTSDGTNRILDVFGFGLRSMTVSPDGATVVAADISGNLRRLDIDSGQQVGSPLQGVPGATDVVFSPDGLRLVGGGPGPIVYLWNLESGEIERQVGNAVGPQVVVFVNDGRELRAVSAEGVVRGYTLDSLELLEIARGKVERSPTEEECHRYLRRSCDG
ncbi:MAG TPA: protein kinase, partial [Acidimicrobiia bacterium]|nr:protein kinase [Acidimicrobiia bacterium]